MKKLCAVLATAIACMAVAAVGTGDAGAHSEQGLLALTAEAAADARVVLLVATLKYANDGDVVPNAVVTAAATNAAGESTAPMTLADEGEGHYRGELVLPSDGKWDVTVRSEAPVASASASVTVSARPPSSTTTVPLGPRQTTSDVVLDSNNDTVKTVLGVFVAIALVAGVGYLLVRRRR